ncbi:MAG: hypothetical protein ACRCUS_06855 [Anaerovoracaceae bacterium]
MAITGYVLTTYSDIEVSDGGLWGSGGLNSIMFRCKQTGNGASSNYVWTELLDPNNNIVARQRTKRADLAGAHFSASSSNYFLADQFNYDHEPAVGTGIGWGFEILQSQYTSFFNSLPTATTTPLRVRLAERTGSSATGTIVSSAVANGKNVWELNIFYVPRISNTPKAEDSQLFSPAPYSGNTATAAATVAKTVTSIAITAGAPTFSTINLGHRISLTSTNVNTASNPTLNVMSNGAKPIFKDGMRITSGAIPNGIYENDGVNWNYVGAETESYFQRYGKYIRNKSKVKVTWEEELSYSSPIASRKLENGAAALAPTSKTSEYVIGNLGYDSKSEFKLTITDQRTRVSTPYLHPLLPRFSGTEAYKKPTMLACEIKRGRGSATDAGWIEDEEGSIIRLKPTWDYAKLDNKNTICAKYWQKNEGASSFTQLTAAEHIKSTNGYIYLSSIPTTMRSEFKAQLIDGVGETSEATYIIDRSKVNLYLNATGDGVSIGEKNANAGLNIAWKTNFTGGLHDDSKILSIEVITEWKKIITDL